jgi:hypothetical protein
MKLTHLSFLLIALAGHPTNAVTPLAGLSDSNDDVYIMQEEEMVIDHIFAPGEISTSEPATVMVSGWLPSPCYSSPRADVSRQDRAIVITVKATKNLAPGRVCVALAVPYLVAVPLGILSQGRYVVEYGPEDLRTETELRIHPAQAVGANRLIYARVEQIKLDARRRQLVLSGRNSSDCVALDRVTIASNGVDTYTVAPVMKLIRSDCPKKLVPFEYRVNIPGDLDEDQILYYVRTLNGGDNFINYLQNTSPQHWSQ